MPAGYQGKPFNDATYRAERQAQAELPALPYKAFSEALVLWDSKASTNGTGWVTGGDTGAALSLGEPEADGRRPLHFHSTPANYRYVAFGWSWPAPPGKRMDLRGYGAVSFSLKVTGPKKMQELFFGVNADTNSSVSIRPFQPSFADGAWHRVTIPIHALRLTPAAELAAVRGFALKTFVWNAADFDVLLDHLSLDRWEGAAAAGFIPAARAETPPVGGQPIPGRLECAYYDLGGEGIAYHDTTPVNTLSAVLNQQAIHQRPHATAYHWDFRRDEAVDVSFVKDFADLNHTNRAAPAINQLYIGSTEDGEWCNYTVVVKKAGNYRIIAGYGNVAGAKPLRFSLDGRPAADCPCPVVTGSMHQWTREDVGTIVFPKTGRHLLTLHYERGYNLGYFEFEEAK